MKTKTNTETTFNACLVTAETKELVQNLRSKYDVTEKQLMMLVMSTVINNESELAQRVADLKVNIDNVKQVKMQAAKEAREQAKLERKQVRLESQEQKAQAKAEAAAARKAAREAAKAAKAAAPESTIAKAE